MAVKTEEIAAATDVDAVVVTVILVQVLNISVISRWYVDAGTEQGDSEKTAGVTHDPSESAATETHDADNSKTCGSYAVLLFFMCLFG